MQDLSSKRSIGSAAACGLFSLADLTAGFALVSVVGRVGSSFIKYSISLG